MRAAVLVAVVAAKLAAQEPSVLELARKAPPEIFADAVIKLVERGEIPTGLSSIEQRQGLLEEAFEAAKHAREPVRLRALPVAGTNTRAALRDAAGALGLDTLSLESRVIKLMDGTNPDRARALFQSVEHPALEARPCEDPTIADASAYYETAGYLAGGQAPLLMLAVGRANSPSELASFAKVLVTMRALPPQDLRLLAGALALKMEMAAPDYRSFTMTADELRAGLEGLGATAELAEGVRKLVIAQMSSPRCNEEFGDAAGFVEWFNTRFRGALAQAKPDPIREEETWSRKPLGRFKAENYFGSGDAQQIADDFGKARMALSRVGVTPEWRALLTGFLTEFSAWKPEGADIDVFHQKMTVLHGLFQLIPPGEDRDALIAHTVDVLRSSGIEREYPAEWLVQVRSFASSATGDRAKLLAAFHK